MAEEGFEGYLVAVGDAWGFSDVELAGAIAEIRFKLPQHRLLNLLTHAHIRTPSNPFSYPRRPHPNRPYIKPHLPIHNSKPTLPDSLVQLDRILEGYQFVGEVQFYVCAVC